MTCGDIIAKVDTLEPNQYDTTQKLAWLSELDGKIIDTVIRTHAAEPGAMPPPPHWPDPLSPGIKIWPNVPIAAGRPPEPPVPPEPLPAEDESEEEEEPEKPKPPYASPNDELIVKDPYGSSIYTHWLQAMIHSENSEIVKYNQQTALFQAAYKEWTDYYNRTHMPLGAARGNRFTI